MALLYFKLTEYIKVILYSCRPSFSSSFCKILSLFLGSNFSKFNLFVSGNIDLNKMNASFYEIFVYQKLNNDDVNYIEKEFNDIMFEDGYDNLFVFPKLKEFIKTVTSEEN